MVVDYWQTADFILQAYKTWSADHNNNYSSNESF